VIVPLQWRVFAGARRSTQVAAAAAVAVAAAEESKEREKGRGREERDPAVGEAERRSGGSVWGWFKFVVKSTGARPVSSLAATKQRRRDITK